MKRFIFLILLLLFPILCYSQVGTVASGKSPETILHIEVRDYNGDQGWTGNKDGWTYFTWWNTFALVQDSSLHGGYNDSAASAVVGNTQYQVNCICNVANPTNMFVRNYSTQALVDSFVICSNQAGHTTHRLTLLGICKMPNSDSLILGGYERYNNPPTITHPDTMYGFWTWYPGETTAYWRYDTEVGGSFCMNGLAINGNYIYSVSEMTDTLEVVDYTTKPWSNVAYKDMGQTGGTFRGIAVIGSTILVNNSTDVTLDYYNLYTLDYITNRDMSDFVDAGNILYGLWLHTKNRY